MFSVTSEPLFICKNFKKRKKKKNQKNKKKLSD